MSKVIGKAKVLSTEGYTTKDGRSGYRCVCMTDENQPTVIYRPADETPKQNDVYNMVLGYDKNLKAVVRYQKES